MLEKWIIYALLSAVFASLVTIFGKIGLKNIDATLATSVRAFVMFMVIAGVVLFQKTYLSLNKIPKIGYIFIILAGIAGALSWIFYFSALKVGPATRVATIDKLSLIFILIFSLLFLGEKFSLKETIGAVLVVIGSILMIL